VLSILRDEASMVSHELTKSTSRWTNSSQRNSMAYPKLEEGKPPRQASGLPLRCGGEQGLDLRPDHVPDGTICSNAIAD
jgi:hypothetical protein